MKKLIFFSLIAVLFLIVGCDLLCPPEPPVVVIKYTLEASASVGGSISPSGKIEVKIDSIQTFTMTPDFGYAIDSIVLTNKFGISKTFPLTTNTYVLLITPDVYKVKAIFVDIQIKQNLGLLTQKPWKSILWQRRPIGTTDWFTQSGETGMTGTWIFGKNYRWQSFNNNNNVLNGEGDYILTKDSLIISGFSCKIITLSENTLVIMGRVPYYDSYGKRDPTKDEEHQFTYIHP